MHTFNYPLYAPCCQILFLYSSVFQPLKEGLATCTGEGVGVQLETVDGVSVCVGGGAMVLELGETVGREAETVGEAGVGLMEEFVVWFEDLGGGWGRED
jgi:hypothetical protein